MISRGSLGTGMLRSLALILERRRGVRERLRRRVLQIVGIALPAGQGQLTGLACVCPAGETYCDGSRARNGSEVGWVESAGKTTSPARGEMVEAELARSDAQARGDLLRHWCARGDCWGVFGQRERAKEKRAAPALRPSIDSRAHASVDFAAHFRLQVATTLHDSLTRTAVAFCWRRLG